MHTLANLKQLITFIARYLLRTPMRFQYYSEVLNTTQGRPFIQEENEMNSFHQSQLYFSI